MISIRQPLCFSEIGKKDNQEDFLFPANADSNTRVFILCDGMGGHDNGEVASMTAATSLGRSLSALEEVNMPLFEKSLDEAYDALDAIDTLSDRKPGTTMTALCLNRNSYLVAHIGDSRIYHIRPSLYNDKEERGGIIYQSSDHSLVNDLLKVGEITEEEAINFPQKNVITRAMQPHLQRRHKADIFLFDDIASGDYFFMCSDGVLEQLSNKQLCKILSDNSLSDHQKLDMIKTICQGKTRDNFTCWLIPVDKVDIPVGVRNSQVIQASEDEKEEITAPPVLPPENAPASPPPMSEVIYPLPKGGASTPHKSPFGNPGVIREDVIQAPRQQPERPMSAPRPVKKKVKKTISRRKVRMSQFDDEYDYEYAPELIFIGVGIVAVIIFIVWFLFKFFK